MCEISTLSRRRSLHAFTVAEALIALAIVSMCLVGGFSAIAFSRVSSLKAKERGMVIDFLVHYAENIKGLPFSDVVGGAPINPLFDGSDGGLRIEIPSSTNWVSLSTADFASFHPDLQWIGSRNPELQVTLTTKSVGGEAHTKHLKIRVAWDPPINRGSRLMEEINVIRVVDL